MPNMFENAPYLHMKPIDPLSKGSSSFTYLPIEHNILFGGGTHTFV